MLPIEAFYCGRETREAIPIIIIGFVGRKNGSGVDAVVLKHPYTKRLGAVSVDAVQLEDDEIKRIEVLACRYNIGM